jgi:type II secretory pathway pseudopilin PulG
VAAFSLIELTFVLGVAATLASVAVPRASAALDEFRAAGAARYVAARLQQARVQAITRSCDTALRITRDARGFVVSVYEDGNQNGVLTRDIQDGIDVPVGPAERVIDQFPGVDFGALPAVAGAEGSTPPGTDPIRLGSADSVTFTPTGTATSGSLYLLGHGASQYVVRIYGETGRTRILKYDARSRTWLSR